MCLRLAVPAQAASTSVVKVFPPNSDSHYNDFGQFSEGVALSFFNTIDDERGWCFVDPSGRETTPSHYYALGNLSDGLAAVLNSNGWGFVNVLGQFVVPLPVQ
ncbi:MAG: WG repeat-containing protein [Lachnospiraceae bacterium]|nr:WG repeat-containing protein [Lachnospiraceae bacterium]